MRRWAIPGPGSGPATRGLALTAIPLVGLTRLYVGAHLPLDIVGGAALGLTADAAAGLVLARPRNPCGHRGFPGCRAARPPAS